jgi:putative FmdB family regulatory protein
MRRIGPYHVGAKMPIYDYKCENGHRFEAMQSMSDVPIDECDVCGAPAHRVLHAPAVHFKGSGFYTTDYARKGKAKDAANGSEPAKGDKATKEAKGGDSSSSKTDSGSASSSGGEKAKAKKD